jgi:hypothetical protein
LGAREGKGNCPHQGPSGTSGEITDRPQGNEDRRKKRERRHRAKDGKKGKGEELRKKIGKVQERKLKRTWTSYHKSWERENKELAEAGLVS